MDLFVEQFPFMDLAPIKSLMYPLEEQALKISEMGGLPIDQVNFLLLFFLSYPLALIHRQIWNPTLRHIFSAFFGVLTVIYMMGNDFYHSLFSAIVTYIILCTVRHPIGTKLIWIWAFGYMTGSHVYRLYIDYMGWKVDFTIVQMVFTFKFCALACNLQDGTFPQGNVSSVHKARAISAPPSILEYFSYLYYWCTILPGPFFEFNDYKSFIDRSMFKETNGEIPSGGAKALLKIIFRLVFAFTGVFLAFNYHPSFLWKQEEFAMGLNVFYRWAYCIVAFAFMRSSYYVGWLMSEAAVVISGFGFNGYNADKSPKWNRLTNIDMINVEFGGSLKGMIAAWNQGTAGFLKVYVYFRVTKPRAKEGQDPKTLKGLSQSAGQMVVFVVSALWHGCYPGYYYFFVFEFFMNYIGAWGAKRITPLVPKNSAAQFVYYVFCCLLSLTALNYGALTFIALSHELSMVVLKNTHYSGLIIGGIVFVFALLDPIRPKRRQKTE